MMAASWGPWIALAQVTLIAILLSLLVHWLHHALSRYRYDERNPARRWCKLCGQQQNQFARTFDFRNTGWWETVLPVPDPECRCHGDAEYRR